MNWALGEIGDIAARNHPPRSQGARDVERVANLAHVAVETALSDARTDAEHAGMRQRWNDDRRAAEIQRLRDRVALLEAEKRERATLIHDQANEGDEVRVKFNAHQWDVEMLEQAAYRIRLAGGTDYTPVEIAKGSISSVVANPCIVNLDLARGPDTPETITWQPPEPEAFHFRPHNKIDVRLTLGLLLLVIAAITAGVIL